jgi:hypothetical protein
MKKTVYISSTYKDLQEYRKAVYDALHKMQYDVVCMEDYVASDERNVDKCCAHASSCDFYIGIFARRYGYIPADDNPDKVSITEMEYRAARASKRAKVLVFLLKPDASWPQTEPEESEKQTNLARLREELSKQAFGPFATTTELVEQVMASVHIAESEVRVQPLPEDLRNADRLYLNNSGYPEITSKIQAAIMEAHSVAALQVNLGLGVSWFSTRLHLVAALCAEYTSIPQIVFVGKDDRYLGMCAPAEVRRALAVHFRDVERAYRESIPEQFFDPATEIPQTVQNFANKLDSMSGGENAVKKWVAPYVLEQWRAFNSDAIEMTNRTVTPALLDEIIERHAPYVALVRKGKLETLQDRGALATSLALRRH